MLQADERARVKHWILSPYHDRMGLAPPTAPKDITKAQTFSMSLPRTPNIIWLLGMFSEPKHSSAESCGPQKIVLSSWHLWIVYQNLGQPNGFAFCLFPRWKKIYQDDPMHRVHKLKFIQLLPLNPQGKIIITIIRILKDIFNSRKETPRGRIGCGSYKETEN